MKIEKNKQQIIILNSPATMDNSMEAVRVCTALGGEMDAMQTIEELNQLDNFTCTAGGGKIWAPVFRDEDIWRDHRKAPVSLLPWHNGAPNDGPSCAVYIVQHSIYFALNCNSYNCFYCQMKSKDIFKLKGHIHSLGRTATWPMVGMA